MKIFRTRKQLLAFFMPGFLLGVIYVNFIAKRYMAEPGIFSDYFLDQFLSTKIDVREYVWYLIRSRLVPVSFLSALSFTRAGKVSAFLFLFWTGISGGILVSSAILNLGIKGSLLCIVCLIPQFFLYIPACIVILWHCVDTPVNQWNYQKTIFVILCMFTGIILELYVNPVIVRAFLSVF